MNERNSFLYVSFKKRHRYVFQGGIHQYLLSNLTTAEHSPSQPREQRCPKGLTSQTPTSCPLSVPSAQCQHAEGSRLSCPLRADADANEGQICQTDSRIQLVTHTCTPMPTHLLLIMATEYKHRTLDLNKLYTNH